MTLAVSLASYQLNHICIYVIQLLRQTPTGLDRPALINLVLKCINSNEMTVISDQDGRIELILRNICLKPRKILHEIIWVILHVLRHFRLITYIIILTQLLHNDTSFCP